MPRYASKAPALLVDNAIGIPPDSDVETLSRSSKRKYIVWRGPLRGPCQKNYFGLRRCFDAQLELASDFNGEASQHKQIARKWLAFFTIFLRCHHDASGR